MRALLLLLVLASLAACSKQDANSAGDRELVDLGILNTLVVEPQLASSGQPSEEQFAKLAAAGYTHVISLRPASEDGTGWEEARAQELGIRFVRLPVAGNEDLTEANARALDEALKKGAGAPTLVYCTSGNRVGGLYALKAHFVDGLAPEAALARGKNAGLTKAEPAVRAALGLPRDE